MPIASGAAGRVVVGVDTSTTWTPDGLKRKTKPANRNCDSYLQRYQEQRKKTKRNLLQGIQENTDPSDHETDGGKNADNLKQKTYQDCLNVNTVTGGTKEGNPQGDGSSEGPTSGEPSGAERSKKSLLCVLL